MDSLDLMQLLSKGPIVLLEFRSCDQGMREWVDKKTGKARSMAIQSWRCETPTGQQAQVGIIANQVPDLPPCPYVQGDSIVVVCQKVEEQRDVLSIRPSEHIAVQRS